MRANVSVHACSIFSRNAPYINAVEELPSVVAGACGVSAAGSARVEEISLRALQQRPLLPRLQTRAMGLINADASVTSQWPASARAAWTS